MRHACAEGMSQQRSWSSERHIDASAESLHCKNVSRGANSPPAPTRLHPLWSAVQNASSHGMHHICAEGMSLQGSWSDLRHVSTSAEYLHRQDTTCSTNSPEAPLTRQRDLWAEPAARLPTPQQVRHLRDASVRHHISFSES